MRSVHFLLTRASSREANRMGLSMPPVCSQPSGGCHPVSRATAAFTNAWLTRLHENWSKKTQARVSTMTEDPLAIAAVRFATSHSVEENDWNVLKLLSGLGVGASLGLLEGSNLWLLFALNLSPGDGEPFLPGRPLWEAFLDCVLPSSWRWMDVVRESYWGVNTITTEFFLARIREVACSVFKTLIIHSCKVGHNFQPYLSTCNYYALNKHILYNALTSPCHNTDCSFVLSQFMLDSVQQNLIKTI